MTTPAAVLALLATGDKSEAQIMRKLRLTRPQWWTARVELMKAKVIATVGHGATKKYTIIDIGKIKNSTLINGW